MPLETDAERLARIRGKIADFDAALTAERAQSVVNLDYFRELTKRRAVFVSMAEQITASIAV